MTTCLVVIFDEDDEATSVFSLSFWFSCGPFILVELELGIVSFLRGSETGEPRKKPSVRGENQPQTQPTYIKYVSDVTYCY